jgi:hypothetical protein
MGSAPGCEALANAACLRETIWYAIRRAGASEAIQISANRGECLASCKATDAEHHTPGRRIYDDLAGFAGIHSVPHTV